LTENPISDEIAEKKMITLRKTSSQEKICFLNALVVGVISAAIVPAHAGSITGEVAFSDPPPKLAPVKVTKDQDYCGTALPNESYVIGAKGGLKNVVVFVEAASIASPPAKVERVLDNKSCRFAPRVLVMRKGEKLIVRNSDTKLHIAHSYLDQRTVFTFSLPFRGTSLEATQKIRQSGILKVSCDTHAWMRAYIHVFDHPFFAVTDEQGNFTIPDVPPGQYILKAWHEEAGIRTQVVTVSESGASQVAFEFGKK
jgi:hypothetical protein